jgi:hypothetical protein
LLRQDFVPMVAGYLIIMAALALGLRLARRAPARPGAAAAARVSAAGWWRLARQVAGTMVGGYLLLMAIVILYYYLVARVGGAFIKSAFTGCALLIGLVTPVFAAASWLAERGRERRAAKPPAARTEPR